MILHIRKSYCSQTDLTKDKKAIDFISASQNENSPAYHDTLQVMVKN